MSIDDMGRSAGADLRDAIGSAGVSPPPFGRIADRARRRRQILASVSAAVILAAGGAVVRVGAGTSHRHLLVTGGPTTTPPVQTVPSTTTSITAPARQATPFDRGWRAVPVETGDPQAGDVVPATLRVAALGKPGIVAFGDVVAGASSNLVGGWFSPDGSHWQRIPNAATIFGDNGTGIVGPATVVAWHNGFVAVGVDNVPSQSYVAAVWSSPDGLHWVRETPHAAVFANAGMSGAVVFGDTIIAGGSSGDYYHPAATLWRSTDGKNWQRLATDPSVFGGASFVRQLAIGVHGLLAWGVTPAAGAPTTLWTSRDGNLWQRTAALPSEFSGPYEPFIPGPGGTDLMIGNSRTAPHGPEVWQSTDDITWSPVNNLRFPTSPGSGVVALGVAQGHALAAATDSTTTTLWSSADGRSWDQVTPDPTIFPSTPWGPTGVNVLLPTPTGALLAGGVPVQPANKPADRPTVWLWSPTAG